ncbi:hypothetical protein C3747_7g502 [Trypanosoma cruzi]|uniref:Uncharacterized protein n=1 Tax=Trypanosoma cruzi TaxID=5693 RepID=A0A2V2XGZ4_TRYCR|nr:hypothetical protein C3747_7g502 [Trypanosoma cruzi]
MSTTVPDCMTTLVPQGREVFLPSTVVAMTVTPDTVWLAMADGGVEVRDGLTAGLLHRFASAPRPTSVTRIWSLIAVTTQSKGPQVWMGLSSGSVEVYDARSFALVRQMNKHAGGVYCLAEFGGYVYSGGSDFKIAQWSAEDGKVIRVLHGHTNYVRCLYAEGNAVVSGSDDCTVRVWDAGSGEAQLTGHFHGRAGVSALCRVGVTMWSGDNDGRVIAWKLNTCEALRVLHAHGGRVASLRKIGSRVYSGGADGIIAVFDAEDCQLVQRIEDHRGARITTVQCAVECGRHSVWTAASDNTVRCWHHDDHWAMTSERERFNDMRWYYATVRSHHETNERLLKQQRELMELVFLSQGGENAVRHVLTMNEEMKSSALLNCWMMQEKMREFEKRTQELQNERSHVEAEIQKQEQNLQVMRGLLQKTLEAVQRARDGGAKYHVPESTKVATFASEGTPAGPTVSTATMTAPPTASLPAPPTASLPAPPTASVPAPPTASVPAPPTASVPAPPTASVPAPPTASLPAPPTASVPAPPTASVPAPPTASVPAPPTTSVPAPPTASVPAPPTGPRSAGAKASFS